MTRPLASSEPLYRYETDSEWYTYLENVKDKSMSVVLTSFYNRLNEAVDGQLRPPTCGIGNTDVWQFAWDNHEHHFDVDVLADGSFDWLYSNRTTNVADGTGEEPDTEITPKIIGYLLLTACRTSFEDEVARFIAEKDTNAATLARECEVMTSTVRRWSTGDARPMPGVLRWVLKEDQEASFVLDFLC